MSCCTPPVMYEQERGVQLDIMLVRITYDRSTTWLLSNTARPLGLILWIGNLKFIEMFKMKLIGDPDSKANFLRRKFNKKPLWYRAKNKLRIKAIIWWQNFKWKYT